MEAPQHPQKIVVQPQGKAQGAGVQKLDRLGLDRIFHQPSSRLRKLPCLGDAS